ncbi:laminin subunit alpha-4 [Protopterus annectens]|uniref:laminin subunit alpha-4 n=1 Tax=Protopterus annectens TaxID=7888 RepID=UPI001CF9B63D|nr:laminin subunit alpha-4 [Protopterus annectens]
MALILTWHCICLVLLVSKALSLASDSGKNNGYPLNPRQGWTNLIINPAVKEQHSVSARNLPTFAEKCGVGSYLTYEGNCLPCNCNGHSDKCLDGSGICIGCDGNTAGSHCETCRDGYIGNVVRGVPSSCTLCPCPLALESNNFALSCGRRSGVVRCVCRENYAGRNCERCAPGYYGNPLIIGNSCKKCNCHGNSDPNLIFDDCDETTGHCRYCLHNTTGVHCERCAPGFYGDAILAKNCTACHCNKCGTHSCDEISGRCRCRPGVTGALCDHCQDGYYGFDSCTGCQNCECSLAAIDRICDPFTRQCKCQPGAGGLHCERCKKGHWNYGPYGCQPCLCDGGPCDSQTGKCLEHSDEEPDDTECDPVMCDKCIWDSMDDLKSINETFLEATSSIESISLEVNAHRYLSDLNSTVAEFKVQLHEKRINADFQIFLTNNTEKTVSNFWAATDTLAAQEKNISTKGQLVVNDTKEVFNNAEKMSKEIVDLKLRIQEMAFELDYYGKEHELTPEDMQQKLKKAEEMLRKMEKRKFIPQGVSAATESRNAENVLNQTRQFLFPHSAVTSMIPALWSQFGVYKSKLSELQNALNESHRNVIQTQNKNQVNTHRFQETESQQKQLMKEADTVNRTLLKAENILSDTALSISELDNLIKNVSELHAEIDGAKKPLRERLANLSSVDGDIVQRAMDHAQELRRLAENLEADMKNTDANGLVQKALNASNVYNKIVKYISEANESVVATQSETARAVDAIAGIRNQITYQKNKSSGLLEEAKELQKTIEDRTDMAVDRTKYRVESGIRKKERLTEQMSGVISQIKNLPEVGSSRQMMEKARQVAEEALNATVVLRETISPMEMNVKQWTENLRNSEYDSSTYDRAADSARVTVRDLTEIVPQLLDKLRVVEEKPPLSNLSTSIRRIRELIAHSRNVASKVQVSMTFKGQSAVDVRPQTKPEELRAFTSMSLYMSVPPSDQEKQPDRFVMYLGNKNATTDYIGLAIKKDNLVYVYNLGSGEVEVPLNSRPVSTWPTHFSLIRLERIGKYGKIFLTVSSLSSTAEEKFIQKAEAKGSESLLDLHPDNTVFYVGGVPTGFKLPGSLNLSNFVGCIELATLNDEVISLYNFRHIYNMNTTETPPRPRNKLAFTQSRAATYYFDGTGYAVVRNIERRGRFSQVTRFDLEVRTPSDNALLLLMVNESMFFSLEMQNGYLRLNYDFGFSTGPVLLEDNLKKIKINDARYHEISVIYHNSKKMILVVDRRYLKSVENEKKQIPFTDIYIGGAPSDIVSRLRSHLAVEVGFRGCAKGFQFQKKDFNLLEEPGVLGISSGCPEESLLSRSAYFNGESFIASDKPIYPFDTFEGGFTFRTLQPSGLLFSYGEDSERFSISMAGGTIFFTTRGTNLQTFNQYNDGQSHFVIASVKESNCVLTVDDKDLRRTICEKGEEEQTPETARKYYFGGSPKTQYGNFTGCISNAYLTRVDKDIEVEDFQQYVDNVQVSMHGCPIETPPAALRLKQERNSSGYKKGNNKKIKEQKSLTLQVLSSHNPIEKGKTFEGGLHCSSSSMPGAAQHAHQFGGIPNSRQEFNITPSFFSERSHFSIDLKSHLGHGVIFYVSDEEENNFMTLFLAQGRLHYVFNVGHRKLKIRSQGRYNDGQWHNVIFIRDKNKGRLVIDGLIVQEESLSTTDTDWSVTSPFYVGGIHPNKAQKNIQSSSLYSFSGCLRDFKLNGQRISSPSQSFGVIPCFDGPVEAGTYFSAEGGYVLLDNSFHLGSKFEIVFEVHPRASSGILLHTHGTDGFYLNLNMKHRQVIVQLHNGAQEYSTSVTSQLCDGKWHRIAVIRASNVVQLDVDSEVNYVVGPVTPIPSDNKLPIYVGGAPESLLPPNLTVRQSYVGCIRNFMINKVPVNFSKAALVYGAVGIDFCPAA